MWGHAGVEKVRLLRPRLLCGPSAGKPAIGVGDHQTGRSRSAQTLLCLTSRATRLIEASTMDLTSSSSSSSSSFDTAPQTRPAMDAPMEDVSSHTSLQAAASLYECLAEMPTIAKAEFVGLSDDMVVLTLNYKDHATMATSQRVLHIPTESAERGSSRTCLNQGLAGVAVDPAIKLDFAVHSDSLSRVRLREQTVEGKTRRFVEVWLDVTREYSIEVTESHGSFCTDGQYTDPAAPCLKVC